MEYKISKSEVIFIIPSNISRQGFATCTYKFSQHVSHESVKLLAEIYRDMLHGATQKTKEGHLSNLRIIFGYLKKTKSDLPETDMDSWKAFVHGIYVYCLINTDTSEGDTNTRRNDWGRTRQFLNELIARGFYPSVKLPPRSLPRNYDGTSRKHGYVLGETLEETSIPLDGGEIWPKCYLASAEYLEPTNVFLAKIEEKLKRTSMAVQLAAVDYWQKMLTIHARGRALTDCISIHEIRYIVCTPTEWTVLQNGKRYHVADPRRGKKGMSYFLAAVEYYLLEAFDIGAITWRNLGKIPFFNKIFCNSEIIRVIRSSLNDIIGGLLPVPNFPSKMAMCLGMLTSRDCAVASMILIHEHPRFTPNSLHEAKLFNKSKKCYLLARNGYGSHSFSINKPRAKSRKSEYLNDTSVPIVKYLVRATSRIRNRLNKLDHPQAKYLFLVSTRNGLGLASPFRSTINDPSRFSLCSMWQDTLNRVGLNKETLTLSKIRNTSGILEWFLTKSVVRMATKMGNTVAVILACYMPPWIIRKMYENVARAYQQKLIILASHQQPWQELVVDFSDKESFVKFLRSSLIKARTGDEFTDLWVKSHADYTDSVGIFEKINSDLLYVCLSPESLALMQIFSDNLDSLTAKDNHLKELTDVGVSASDIVGLCEAYKHIIEQPSKSSAEYSVKSNLQGDTLAELKVTWRQAALLKAELVKHNAEVFVA